jgi:hypothetical protein
MHDPDLSAVGRRRSKEIGATTDGLLEIIENAVGDHGCRAAKGNASSGGTGAVLARLCTLVPLHGNRSNLGGDARLDGQVARNRLIRVVIGLIGAAEKPTDRRPSEADIARAPERCKARKRSASPARPAL